MMGCHLRLGHESPLQALDSHILARFASDAFIFNIADLDGEDSRQGLHFSLRLPMDPSTHWVVGQEEDTVGDVINRLKSGPWIEADLLITVNDTPLSWTERVHERVFPGALVIVSLNIRANATTYKAPVRRDQTPSDSGPILTHLKGPTMEVLYSAANGRSSTRSLLFRHTERHLPTHVRVRSDAVTRRLPLAQRQDPYGLRVKPAPSSDFPYALSSSADVSITWGNAV
jgi:hypothetical protein